MQKISKHTQAEIANFSGLLGRVLTEMRLVKISNTEQKELNNAHYNLNEIYKLGLRQAKIVAIIQPISSVIMLLMIAIILGFGAIRIATGAITAGALIAMIFYVMQLSMPLMNLSTLVTDYKKAVGASQRIYEIMQEPVEPMEQLKPINIGIAMKVSKVICQSIINSIIIEPINVIIAGSNCGNF
jgi:ATP-binding cassette, subfamily B, bacterial AbcA/BmrA